MGGGGSTTNVTNTGLGDDQFKTLTENQANIGTSIDTARTDATGRFNTLDGTLSNIRGDISGVGTNLSSGFTNLQDLLGQNMEANRQGFTGVTDNINQATGQIQTGMQTGFDDVNQNLTTGFGTMGDRFDRVDTAQQTAQTALDTGFQNTANNFSDLNTRLTDDFTAAQQTMDTGFADVGEGLSDLDTNTQNRLDTVQGNVLTGQALLDQGITGMSDAQDIYYGDLSGRQMEIQQGQDEFRSNFDDYVQRYSDDTTLANQTRADIQTGLVNATDRIRTDVGNFAQAAATGQAGLASQLGDVATATGDQINRLGATVEGGFSATSMQQQQAQQNLATRLGNVRDLLQTTGENLDAQTRSQYQNLTRSFDAQGNLITNSIDNQGNTIQRSMDQQGNLIETRFDQTGRAIGNTSTNVNQLLSNAERFQQENLQGQVALGNQVQMAQDGLMTQAQAGQTAAADQFGQITERLAGGFQNLTQADIAQARDLARVASAQGDLDMGMRQNFRQLGDAFDDTGNLIQSSIDVQGNVISRAVDDQGNLLLRSFDITGREIGNRVININRALRDLGNLNYLAGANVSMGNLSPAMTGAVPTSGFASPFAMTR